MTTSERFARFAPGFEHLVINFGANTIAVCRKYGYGLDEFNAALQEFFGGRSGLSESTYNNRAAKFGGNTVGEAEAPSSPEPESTEAKEEDQESDYTEQDKAEDTKRWEAHGRQTVDTWKRYQPLLKMIAEQGEPAAVVKLQRGGVFQLSLTAYRVFKSERFGRGALVPDRARAFIAWMDERPVDTKHDPAPPPAEKPAAPKQAATGQAEPPRSFLTFGRQAGKSAAVAAVSAQAPVGFVEIKPPNTGSRRLPHDVKFHRNVNRPGFHWSVFSAKNLTLPADKVAVRVMHDVATKSVLIITAPGVQPERGDYFTLRRYNGKLILNSLAFLEPMKDFPEFYTMQVEDSPVGSDVIRILLTPAA